MQLEKTVVEQGRENQACNWDDVSHQHFMITTLVLTLFDIWMEHLCYFAVVYLSIPRRWTSWAADVCSSQQTRLQERVVRTCYVTGRRRLSRLDRVQDSGPGMVSTLSFSTAMSYMVMV